jgi:Bacterial Ig-like domain (group 2)
MTALRDFFRRHFGGGGTAPPAPPPVVLQSITIGPLDPSIGSGGEQQLRATGEFSDGSTQDLTSAVEWTSSDDEVVSIDSNGLAAAAPDLGEATVTATDTATGVSGSTTVAVLSAKDQKTKTAMREALDQTPPDKAALKKLVKGGDGKLLDGLVQHMPDPPDRAVVTAAIEARFGIKMVDTDPSGSVEDFNEGSKSIKQIYTTMLKVPERDVVNNKSLKEIERSPATSFPYYDPNTKEAVVPANRPEDPGNEIGNSADWTDGDGNLHPAELIDVDEDCKPNGTHTPKYLDWSTLHEVAHAVDDRRNVMGGKGGKKFADWKTHSVKDVAKRAAEVLQYDKKYIEQVLTDAPPANPPPAPSGVDDATWQANQQKADEWCAAVRVGNDLWEKGAESANRALGDRVYHEAYPGDWVSYKLDARKQGITGYQFRHTGEWFAELYAAYFTNKLKPSHPHAAWLKKVEK